MDAPPLSRIVIFGDGRLARAIERGVAARGANVERHAFRETTDLEALDLAHVAAVGLAADDDTGNVDLAITLRAMSPSLRLVVRMFDPTLAAYLQRTLPNITVTSMTDVAAPAFVGAVLDGVERQPRRVHGMRRNVASAMPAGTTNTIAVRATRSERKTGKKGSSTVVVARLSRPVRSRGP